jgi:hypothetical protein
VAGFEILQIDFDEGRQILRQAADIDFVHARAKRCRRSA